MASIESINGNLYLKYYDPLKEYACRKSLKLKDNQANRRAAQKIAKSYSGKLFASGFVDAGQKYIRLSDALQEFLSYKNYKPSTQSVYNLAADHFIRSSGDKFTQDYTNHDFIKFSSYLRKENLSQNSQSMYTRALHSFFNYLVKQKYAPGNIIQSVPYQEKIITSIDLSIVDKILDALKSNPYQYAFIFLAVHTGMRKSTLLDLRWEDIDWKRNLITFRNIKVKGTAFTIPLIPKFKKLFKLLDVQKSGKVFDWDPDYPKNFFRYVQKKLKLKTTYGIHKLKHTFISEAIMQGMPIEAASELTNTTIRTLKKHYTNISKKYLGKELEKIKIGDSKSDSKLLKNSAV